MRRDEEGEGRGGVVRWIESLLDGIFMVEIVVYISGWGFLHAAR